MVSGLLKKTKSKLIVKLFPLINKGQSSQRHGERENVGKGREREGGGVFT